MCLWPSCYSRLSLACLVGSLWVTSGPVERKGCALAPSRSCCTRSRRLAELHNTKHDKKPCPSRRFTTPNLAPKTPRRELFPAAPVFLQGIRVSSSMMSATRRRDRRTARGRGRRGRLSSPPQAAPQDSGRTLTQAPPHAAPPEARVADPQGLGLFRAVRESLPAGLMQTRAPTTAELHAITVEGLSVLFDPRHIA